MVRIERSNWLSTYNILKHYAVQADYTGVTNPYDDIEYPDINIDIPEEVKKEVHEKLGDLFGEIEVNQMFIRLTNENTQTPPHQAHPDNMMGTHTLILYLTNLGGTSLVRHKETGMDKAPETQEHWEAWERDTNTPWAWRVYAMHTAAENKAAIFDSKLMHRAEPIGGFGTTAEDGRLVLTAFFDIKD